MYTPYQPRPVAFLGLETIAGYQLKVYSIHLNGQLFDRSRFDAGWKLTSAALAPPATTSERPGVGFVILHQGRGADYLVLCWWDRENELPTRVFINDQAGWRAASSSESFCVWDLRVMWWEREAYVASVLAGHADEIETYLAMVMQWNM